MFFSFALAHATSDGDAPHVLRGGGQCCYVLLRATPGRERPRQLLALILQLQMGQTIAPRIVEAQAGAAFQNSQRPHASTR